MAFLSDRPCTRTDENDPVVASAAWASRRIEKEEPEFAGVPGATDGTFLWSCKNIPIVTMGAGDRQVPHQVDEWVDLDQLVEYGPHLRADGPALPRSGDGWVSDPLLDIRGLSVHFQYARGHRPGRFLDRPFHFSRRNLGSGGRIGLRKKRNRPGRS